MICTIVSDKYSLLLAILANKINYDKMFCTTIHYNAEKAAAGYCSPLCPMAWADTFSWNGLLSEGSCFSFHFKYWTPEKSSTYDEYCTNSKTDTHLHTHIAHTHSHPDLKLLRSYQSIITFGCLLSHWCSQLVNREQVHDVSYKAAPTLATWQKHQDILGLNSAVMVQCVMWLQRKRK